VTRGRAFFYVQHLLGIGHLKRSLIVARALVHAGWQVTVASGGVDVPLLDRSGLKWVQLPPASAADLSFKHLVDASGQPVDEAWKVRRTQRLLQAWHDAAADALVVELFPFGRRQMRFELLPLLQAARSRANPPLVLSSIRDILGGGQGNIQRQQQMLEAFERHFDHVLVHGDASIIPLEASFALAPQLGERLHYTGYVVDPAAGTPQATAQDTAVAAGAGEVLVSAGGGAVGFPLLDAAIRARPLSPLRERRWRLLAGVNLPEGQLRALQRLADELGEGQVLIERARPDFVAMLAHCAVSISQGGYNTVLELLTQGTRCVVVPFAGGGEMEQSTRARLLADRGWLQCVDEDQLSPATLAAALHRAMQSAPAPRGRIRLDGARRTVELISRWQQQRMAAPVHGSCA
jgi:predicted glycosyltransferase